MLKKYALVGTCLHMFFSCKTPVADQDLKHVFGQPVEDDLSFLWHETSESDYYQFVKRSEKDFSDLSGFLKESNPIHQKLQRFLSDIDATMRRKYPKQFAKVPLPKIKIYGKDPYNKKPNAFVMPIPICYRLPIIWDTKRAKRFGNRSAIFPYEDGGPKEGLWPAAFSTPHDGYYTHTKASDCGSEEALVKEIDKQGAGVVAIWLNNNAFDRSQTQCRLKVTELDGFGHVLATDKCNIDNDLMRLTFGSSYIMLSPASNIITAYEGLVHSLQNDDAVKSTLAHELAHYYRSHTFLAPEIQNYFYYLTDYTNPGKPRRRHEATWYGNMAKEISPPGREFVQIRGSRYQRETYSILSFSHFCDKERPCAAACKLAMEAFDSDSFPKAYTVSASGGFPLSKTEKETVFSFDKLFEACAQDVRIVKGALEGVDYAKNNPGKPYAALNAVQFELDHDYSFFGRCIGNLPKTLRTYLELIEYIDNSIKEKKCDERRVMQHLSDHKVGYYTYEQEADDLGAEIMIENKIPLSAMIYKFKKFSELRGDPGCSKWMEKQKGSAIPILDSYANFHHDSCFRWKNIEAEIKRHKYQSN